jgi:DNA polymerase-4
VLRARGIVTVRLRYANFATVTRRTTRAHAAIDKKTLRRAAFERLDRIVPNRKVRLLGMHLGGRDPSGRTAR